MELIKKLNIPQEPCKLDLSVWDKNSVNSQLRLNKKCNGINHSDRIIYKRPYESNNFWT